jgi:hypothetical protein
MGAVAILMDAVKKKVSVRTMTNRKKPWISKPWRGGMRIAEAMRKEKVNWRIINSVRIETKLAGLRRRNKIFKMHKSNIKGGDNIQQWKVTPIR